VNLGQIALVEYVARRILIKSGLPAVQHEVPAVGKHGDKSARFALRSKGDRSTVWQRYRTWQDSWAIGTPTGLGGDDCQNFDDEALHCVYSSSSSSPAEYASAGEVLASVGAAAPTIGEPASTG